MERWSLTFLEPWWLLGLGLIPLIFWLSRRSLAGLGPIRRWIALGLRSLLIALLVAALAGLELVRSSDQVCTLFVLDQSQSISSEASDQALQAISQAISERPRDEDLAGLIVFGRNPRIELPPSLYPRDRQIRTIGSAIDRQYTDIGSAIQLALGSFPPGTSGRIVLVSDGNENRGQALEQAAASTRVGVPIDVVPIEYHYDAEILVDKIAVPPEMKKGDTVNLKIVIRSGRPAAGVLRLNRIADGRPELIAQERIELREGLNVHYLKQTIDEANFFTYEATFEPDADSEDRLKRNNAASGFTWIRGEGRVLLIEPNVGDHQALVDALRRDNLVVVIRTPEQLSDDLAELRAFDVVIIANVPAENLGEEKQRLLAANTRDLGAGLIMVGGPDSFGPGGYNGSPLEEALPVEMDVPATKITGKGALVLVMHACEIAEGNFWQKKTAELAIKQLGELDECGLVQWNGQTSWAFKLQPVGDRSLMFRRIDRMTPGDMPDFASSMQLGIDALTASDALTKHMIIISDGDPSPPGDELLGRFKQSKVSVTTVSVAAHGSFEKQVMRRIASVTGGRYYEVANPKTLPSIYIKETRTISRPMIYEQPETWTPRIEYGGEPVAGFGGESPVPSIKGLVLTSPKETSIVAIASPRPAELKSSPVLAHWQYGLGRSVAFTTDVGQRWAVDWPAGDSFGKFWSQLVRWSMRSAESQQLQLATQEQDGRVKVVVNATSPNGEFLNLLPLEGSVVRPDATTEPLKLTQTEPGKYEGEFSAEQAGSYLVRVGANLPGNRRELAFSALNISYPAEFRDTQSRRSTMENIALVAGGRVLPLDRFGSTDFFERSAASVRRLQEAWPYVLLVALWIFALDVAVRRISIDVPALVQKARAWLARAPVAAQPMPTLDRLKSVKSEVASQLREREVGAGPTILSRDVPTPTAQETKSPASPPTKEPPSAGTESKESTLERLRDAKRRVWEDREKKPEE